MRDGGDKSDEGALVEAVGTAGGARLREGPLNSDTDSVPGNLCLSCGLCCNGVLFRDVELQAADDVAGLERLGLALERLRRKARFPQPCAALREDCSCAIYANRPQRCRQFDCRVLQSVRSGESSFEAALRVVRQARRQAERVTDLMRGLGERSEHLPLTKRFRRLRRRFEKGFADDETAERYAQLTLAVHDLNLLLQSRFL